MQAECIACGRPMPLCAPMAYSCDCGGLLDVRRSLKGIDADNLKRIFEERRALRGSIYASGVWRYKELIAPELPDAVIVSRMEGNTGLYQAEGVTRYAGMRRVWLKAQSENPSGSFKDNGMTCAISHGRALGYRRFVCASTGNTSASLSMYAAYGGAKSIVLVPRREISENKVLQSLAYGAEVRTFDGTYDDGIRFLADHAERLGLYVCNSLNPMRIEGQKSIAYELAQDMNWRLPDWIVLPGGALSNAAALGKALRELHSLGFIDAMPRVAIVQAERASPFHRMHAGGRKTLVPDPAPKTRASALNIGHPPSWPKALRLLEETRGVTVSVEDGEIMEAKTVIDRGGIGCEPASAAALAGLRRLVRQGVVHPDETAACLLTGHLLKDTDAIREYHLEGRWGASMRNPPRPVDLAQASREDL
ncbi:threonine synthase [Paenibacillus aurantiacus]|uniref:Threonine synthase n=1 Tax=Paenibacillus aurantiacus TaxID=1936118 RepID=A0ABV5KX79_9BACL